MAEGRLQGAGGNRPFRVSPLQRKSGQLARWPAAKQGGTTKAPFRPCDEKGLFASFTSALPGRKNTPASGLRFTIYELRQQVRRTASTL